MLTKLTVTDQTYHPTYLSFSPSLSSPSLLAHSASSWSGSTTTIPARTWCSAPANEEVQARRWDTPRRKCVRASHSVDSCTCHTCASVRTRIWSVQLSRRTMLLPHASSRPMRRSRAARERTCPMHTHLESATIIEGQLTSKQPNGRIKRQPKRRSRKHPLPGVGLHTCVSACPICRVA